MRRGHVPAKRTRKRTISPPSTNLYHYTNQKGLLGITESLELWATKIQYFNDGQELELGLDLARRRLSQMLKEESSQRGYSLNSSGYDM